MKQIHQNEWNQPPECNPGAEAQDVEKAIAFRLSVTLRSAIAEVARLAPDDPKKTLALEHLERAVRLLMDLCEAKPERN